MTIAKKFIIPLNLILFVIAVSVFLYIFGGKDTTDPLPFWYSIRGDKRVFITFLAAVGYLSIWVFIFSAIDSKLDKSFPERTIGEWGEVIPKTPKFIIAFFVIIFAGVIGYKFADEVYDTAPYRKDYSMESPYQKRQKPAQDLFEELNVPPIAQDGTNEDSSPSPSTRPAFEFHGYTCTGDCSGHEAGYEWAERNRVTDTSECNGKSQSFSEGCEAYVNE